jgi:hypothetical protein
MTPQEKVERINKLIASYRELDEAFDLLHEALGFSGESPLHEAAWRTFDVAMESIAREIGDDPTVFGWLHWFIYENDCGAAGMEAGLTNNLRPIKTAAELIELIEEVRA